MGEEDQNEFYSELYDMELDDYDEEDEQPEQLEQPEQFQEPILETCNENSILIEDGSCQVCPQAQKADKTGKLCIEDEGSVMSWIFGLCIAFFISVLCYEFGLKKCCIKEKATSS